MPTYYIKVFRSSLIDLGNANNHTFLSLSLPSNQIPKCCKQLRLLNPNPMGHCGKSAVASHFNTDLPPLEIGRAQLHYLH